MVERRYKNITNTKKEKNTKRYETLKSMRITKSLAILVIKKFKEIFIVNIS